MLAMIPVSLVEAGDRPRRTNPAQVENIRESMVDVGILNPITVYCCKVIRDHVAVDGYGIVAGVHRLEACRQLGCEEIPAQVVDLSELQRQIAECDENLCGPKLTPSERAFFTLRRKDAYEALHPETRAGKAQAAGMNRAKGANVSDKLAPTFTADTAKKTGQSERAVQRDAERGDRIAPQVMAEIKGTRWDKGVNLDVLKRLSHQEQRQAWFRVKNGASPNFEDAYDFIRGEEPPARRHPAPKPTEQANQSVNGKVASETPSRSAAYKSLVEELCQMPVPDRIETIMSLMREVGVEPPFNL
ncbi:MAG: ParB/RepB/Spo0J family partition protein [Hyphomicrobiales bacterium]|nr:ParB/RepB/Spo0J family partition protein [Hyphomicrobiales bacterium]